MTTYGICGVRDAVDVVGPVVAHMLGEVDHVIVSDNLSTDGTFDVLESFGSQITLLSDTDPAHYQGRKMTALASIAEDMGADWVVPFDSDEIWYSPFGRISDVLDDCDRYSICTAAMYDHVATGLDDQSETNPVRRIGWRRRAEGAMPKVAARVGNGLTIGEGNHDASYYRFRPRTLKGQLVIRHFPYRSPEQFVSKSVNGAAALRATDLPEMIGKHWRDYADLAEAHGEDALKGVFFEHFYSADPESIPELIFDPAP